LRGTNESPHKQRRKVQINTFNAIRIWRTLVHQPRELLTVCAENSIRID